MNNRFLALTSLIASSTLFIAGCGDNSSFETPNTDNGTTPPNDNPISQKNFILQFDPIAVDFFDIATKQFTSVTAKIVVDIGDNDNRVITGNRTIFFRSQWGLIDPSCSTVDGGCSVTWRSGDPTDMPNDFKSNILVFSPNGQESFTDINGNGLFDDGDTFTDLDEPYIDVDQSHSYTAGDLIEDTINGRDLTGNDGKHNEADGFYNGPNCSHSTLCSPVLTTVTVWSNGSLVLTGDKKFSIGGIVAGLSTTVVLQNNGGDDLDFPANGNFSFSTKLSPGETYVVTIPASGQPVGQTCKVTSGTGTVFNADITSIKVDCL